MVKRTPFSAQNRHPLETKIFFNHFLSASCNWTVPGRLAFLPAGTAERKGDQKTAGFWRHRPLARDRQPEAQPETEPSGMRSNPLRPGAPKSGAPEESRPRRPALRAGAARPATTMSSPRIPFLPAEEGRVFEALRGFSTRDQCFILFGLHTGFRASELGAISIGHVWDGAAVRHKISLARRNLKGGRGLRRRSVRARTLPLNAAARTAIDNYLNDRLARRGSLGPGEALFRSRKTGQGLSRWQLNSILHRVTLAAGLPPDGRYGCHTLRKTFARKVHRALGGDIFLTREALGHRHVTTTQAYLEPDPVRVRSAILAMGGLEADAEPELPLVGGSGSRCKKIPSSSVMSPPPEPVGVAAADRTHRIARNGA